jgi:hypothetical protein
MRDNKEQIKQMITIELENARLWSSFLIPGVGLVIAILFTTQYFPHILFARIILGIVTFYWVVFVCYKRNKKLNNARDLIAQL